MTASLGSLMPEAEFNSLLGRSSARKGSRTARAVAPRCELIPNLWAAGPAEPRAREQRTPRRCRAAPAHAHRRRLCVSGGHHEAKPW